MIIDFQIIPHKRQRYDTVGEYLQSAGTWYFTCPAMKDRRYAILVFLHEVIEFFMCWVLGIGDERDRPVRHDV